MSRSQGRRTMAAMAAVWTVALAFVPSLGAWTPGTGSAGAASGFVVDRQSRIDVLAYYNTVHAASENHAANLAWTGNVATGVAGTTGAAFKEDVRRRINFYRALCGLPADIVFSATKSAMCQQAALIFAANDDLDHFLTAAWDFYTPDGAEAAANSNIALGSYGPEAVDGFMTDDGQFNEVVGHRRWLLHSRAQEMGTGDVPISGPNGEYNSANAIWVIGNFKAAPAPLFVAWPNQGYVPVNLVPARWSLSRPNANFSLATVTMTQGATNVPTTIISDADNGYGDNSIVWTATGVPTTVTNDLTYNITVAGIGGSGVPTSYSYSVTLFNPDVLGDAVTIAGTSTPAMAGAAYTFNSIAQADQYELNVTTPSAASWTEGAEDATASQVESDISPGYTLRQTALQNTGAKAFQLAFPSGVLSDQSFVVARDIVPTAGSQLQFYDRARFSVNTNTLRAEVSTDEGNTWTSVFSRNGVGLNMANWDGNWIARSINLGTYAGQVVRVRFILRSNDGSVSPGTTSSFGFFVDDITVTNATQLVNATTTTLAGNATSFVLNAATAGAPLVASGVYHLRVRPNVGTRWFGFGPTKVVTVIDADMTYSEWVSALYPSVTEGPNGDHDGDGISNGAEFAFGLNPTSPNGPGAVPTPSLDGGLMTLSYTPPGDLSGVSYGAEWSTDLENWATIPNSGTGNLRTFLLGASGQERMFWRHRVEISDQ